MLKIMEDEAKIFRAWLHRIVKKDKRLTVHGKPAKAKEKRKSGTDKA